METMPITNSECSWGEFQRALSDNRDRYFAQSRMTLAGKPARLPHTAKPLQELYAPLLAPPHKRVWWWLRSLF
jgi:hypothetical protein